PVVGIGEGDATHAVFARDIAGATARDVGVYRSRPRLAIPLLNDTRAVLLNGLAIGLYVSRAHVLYKLRKAVHPVRVNAFQRVDRESPRANPRRFFLKSFPEEDGVKGGGEVMVGDSGFPFALSLGLLPVF